MTGKSPYLDDRMANKDRVCIMQVVFVDIVSYSMRQPYAQDSVIHAFMQSLKKARSETAKQYIEEFHKNDINLTRDAVVLPSGDGAAVGFPFDFIHDLHLSFARHLFRIVDQANQSFDCSSFREHGWCDCHDAFRLRCGISQGTLILYKDLNDNYNLAGEAVNMSARVMGLAGGGQIFLTEYACGELLKYKASFAKQFRKYENVVIKHNLPVNVYQYIDANQPGLDVSHRDDLVPRNEMKRQNENNIALSPAKKKANGLRSFRTKRPKVGTSSRTADAHGHFVDDVRDHLIEIPAGEFQMGTVQTGQVLTRISVPFLMNKYPITQAVYERVMRAKPSRFIGADRPVDSISWHDAIAFCNELSSISELEPVYHTTGEEVEIDLHKDGYRLPTETEWEYACLGGNEEDSYGPIDSVAWYNKNSDGQTHGVGAKPPNAFGLYDMLGNVWEWCHDWYQKNYPANPHLDYIGPPSGLQRVIRGGSWSDLPNSITARSRFRKIPESRENTLGFRVVRRPRS